MKRAVENRSWMSSGLKYQVSVLVPFQIFALREFVCVVILTLVAAITNPFSTAITIRIGFKVLFPRNKVLEDQIKYVYFIVYIIFRVCLPLCGEVFDWCSSNSFQIRSPTKSKILSRACTRSATCISYLINELRKSPTLISI